MTHDSTFLLICLFSNTLLLAPRAWSVMTIAAYCPLDVQ
jgi:hypothetical protein